MQCLTKMMPFNAQSLARPLPLDQMRIAKVNLQQSLEPDVSLMSLVFWPLYHAQLLCPGPVRPKEADSRLASCASLCFQAAVKSNAIQTNENC